MKDLGLEFRDVTRSYRTKFQKGGSCVEKELQKSAYYLLELLIAKVKFHETG